MSTVLALIAKAPVAGEVKTRLCPPLTPDQAARVAAALLLDVAAAAGRTGHEVWCVHAGPPASLARLLPGVPLLAQRGDGLAQRLANAQGDLHADGYDRVVLVGADCPTLSTGDLEAALRLLGTADVVLGPAEDGGYTLLATSAPEPGLFDGVAMGTSQVLAQTVAQAGLLGLSVALTGRRYDVDTAADVRAAHRAGQLDAAPCTLAACAPLLASAMSR